MLKIQAQFQYFTTFSSVGQFTTTHVFLSQSFVLKSSFDIALFSLEENKDLLLLPMR